GGIVIHVADFGEDASLDGVGGNAAVAMDHDADDEVLLGCQRGNQERKRYANEKAIADGRALPNTCGERSWRPRGVSRWVSPGAQVTAGTRRAHRNSMMTAMNRYYLEKLESGKR